MAIKLNKNKEFTELIKQNNLKFYKTAKAILKNDDDAYDAIQNALISMYENIHNLKDEKCFTTWGIRIVVNKCYDLIRKNNKVVSISLDNEQNKNEIETNDEYNLDLYGLEKILHDLDEQTRLLITLYYYDDLSINEISTIMNIPKGTVKSRLSRARNILKEKLEREGI